ncbi:MAG: glutamine synthetase [Actinomycetia bacterium]|nr:glutamine synthetase [Actinomycetes bacterium]
MDTLHERSQEFDRIQNDLRDAGVRFVVGAYADIAGRARGKIVPVGRVADLLAGSERYTPRGLDGFGSMDPVEDECVTIPDPAALQVLPWNHELAFMPADLSQEGRAYDLCARTILKQQLDRAAAMGFRFMLGVETEVYVFRGEGRDPDVELVPLHASGSRYPTPAYLVDAAFDSLDFLGPMVAAMDEAGFGVFSFDQEGGNGQYEFDFAHDEALVMADRLLLFKLMVKEYARQAGGFATFMPKPTTDAWGSGAHFNMSLESIETGENLFRVKGTDDEPGEWTPTCRSFLAGILAHARALAAITNPTVNSYKRLVGGLTDGEVSWAPIWASVGDNNRSCMLRLPRNRPALENRLVDSAANPYLAAAFILAAGLEGIEKSLEPPEFTVGETYQQELSDLNRERRLPRTLLEATEAFVIDPLTHSTFSAGFVKEYVAMKEHEWFSYHDQVSDWERRRYLLEL